MRTFNTYLILRKYSKISFAEGNILIGDKLRKEHLFSISGNQFSRLLFLLCYYLTRIWFSDMFRTNETGILGRNGFIMLGKYIIMLNEYPVCLYALEMF